MQIICKSLPSDIEPNFGDRFDGGIDMYNENACISISSCGIVTASDAVTNSHFQEDIDDWEKLSEQLSGFLTKNFIPSFKK